MNKLLVVGSVALDSVETPFGKAECALGGSATYFSLAASYFSHVHIVGVVGEDFPKKYVQLLKKRNIDVEGLKQECGKTFRWSGVYSENLNERETKDLQLNVFSCFNPELPDKYKNVKNVFLANIDPALQVNILNQMKKPALIASDTMDHWIGSKKKELINLLKFVDIFIINDSEAKQFTGVSNLVHASEKIRKMGPSTVIIKKGEHGVFCSSGKWHFAIPAYPLRKVCDPTGAGDTFAGGFMGYLTQADKLTDEHIRKAVIYGSVMASFCCENFSVNKLLNLTDSKIKQRYNEFKNLTHF